MAARDEIASLKARIARLEREADRERDYLIGSVLNALRSVKQVQEATGVDAALTYFQKQAGVEPGTRQDGSYTQMRREAFELLLEFDLVHSDGRFKFHKAA